MQTFLEELLKKASEMGAGTLLLLPGQQPVCRVGRVLQPPLSDEAVTPEQTREVAESLMHDGLVAALDAGDSVEAPFLIGTVSGQVTIFLGLGHHHLVFHLDPPV